MWGYWGSYCNLDSGAPEIEDIEFAPSKGAPFKIAKTLDSSPFFGVAACSKVLEARSSVSADLDGLS